MQYEVKSPQEYIELLPDDRKEAVSKLRKVILKNIPKGFSETINYGMIGYVVPHSEYPDGYHCDPKMPLPFMNLASQKNYIAVYHSGIYASEKLLSWFVNEYPKHSLAKLDMGKSCIRFKQIDQIPFQLIGELSGKITKDEWVSLYESQVKQARRKRK